MQQSLYSANSGFTVTSFFNVNLSVLLSCWSGLIWFSCPPHTSKKLSEILQRRTKPKPYIIPFQSVLTMTYSYSSHTQGDYSRKVWKGWTVETHRGEKKPSKSLFGSTAGGSRWSICYCCEWNTESFPCNWKYDKVSEVSQKNFKEKRHKNHLSISITWQSQSLLLLLFFFFNLNFLFSESAVVCFSRRHLIRMALKSIRLLYDLVLSSLTEETHRHQSHSGVSFKCKLHIKYIWHGDSAFQVYTFDVTLPCQLMLQSVWLTAQRKEPTWQGK